MGRCRDEAGSSVNRADCRNHRAYPDDSTKRPADIWVIVRAFDPLTDCDQRATIEFHLAEENTTALVAKGFAKHASDALQLRQRSRAGTY